MIIQRTKNTTRNIIWGFGNTFLKMLLAFISRTVMLKILGEEYLGLSSLFSSILIVLNLADLGFASAIVYSMYRPIADDDQETICALLALYKKIYRIIGVAVLILGLSLLPLLKYLIQGTVPSAVNIYWVYLIYLINSVLSYWMFAYLGSILTAHHRNDITVKISSCLTVIQYFLQIGLLLVVENYYYYLIIIPMITLLNNIMIARTVKKYFPQYYARGEVSKEVKNGIRKKVGGLFLSKVCGTTRNSLDNIVISSFLGLTYVAMYSNYYYILSSVHSILTIIGQSMLAGVGNSIAKDTPEKNYNDFTKFSFLYAWVAGWCCCTLLALYNHFMYIWVGSDLMFSPYIAVLFSAYLYMVCTTDIKNVYVDATGLWWENRNRSICETLVNLVLNFTLGFYFGVTGILVATLITIVAINFVWGNYILFKHYFVNQNLWKHFAYHVYYICVTILAAALTYLACGTLPSYGIVFLIGKLSICAIVPNAVFFLFYYKIKFYRSARDTILRAMYSMVRR